MTFAAADEFELTAVAVRTRNGQNGRGSTYADPVPRQVFVEDGRKRVRDANGDLVVSETTVYDTPDQVALYAYGSAVDIGDVTSHVITCKRRVMGDPDVDHLEINLT